VSVSTTAEDDALLQERLGLFAKTLLVITVVTTAVGFIYMHFFPSVRPRNIGYAQWIALAGIFGLAIDVAILRARKCSAQQLRALDATISLGGGVLMGLGAFLVAESPVHVFIPFTVTVLMVFARVFIVPSSPRLTALLTIGMILPLSGGDIAVGLEHPELLQMPFSAYSVAGTVLAVGIVAVAMLGSRVIYGLRREIRHAMRYGQYTLDRKLGEGGMGVVFKAQHALLRRPTAIKLLPPSKASAQDVARFEREVQLTAELTHPNTIAIFDYGRSTDGTFYYVMEYLDGIDLETLVERHGALPYARAIPILIQICDALDEAHDRGVIHRDIKPANVILCQRGRTPDFVKVVDFGLVKELAKNDGVTAEGTISGTPAYMAPEALTHPDAVGPASDVYAVGALAYFLVTGKLVFESDTVVGMCAHHLNTAPAAPSTRTAKTIPAELDALILRCLAKKPEGRPASAHAVASALARIPQNGWSAADATAFWDDAKKHTPDTPRGVGVADTIAVMPRVPMN
jgi:serine/threonine-protein kinase